MADDNNLARARAALEEDIDDDLKKEIQEQVNRIDKATEQAAALDLKRRELREEGVQINKEIEAGNARLIEILPANPLGVLTIG